MLSILFTTTQILKIKIFLFSRKSFSYKLFYFLLMKIVRIIKKHTNYIQFFIKINN